MTYRFFKVSLDSVLAGVPPRPEFIWDKISCYLDDIYFSMSERALIEDEVSMTEFGNKLGDGLLGLGIIFF